VSNGGMLTDPQRTAITNPCIEAEQCAHPMYRRILGPWSLILTVNSGFE